MSETPMVDARAVEIDCTAPWWAVQANFARALERDPAKMKAALEGLSSVARILVQDESVRGSLSLEGWIATAYNTLDSLEVK